MSSPMPFDDLAGPDSPERPALLVNKPAGLGAAISRLIRGLWPWTPPQEAAPETPAPAPPQAQATAEDRSAVEAPAPIEAKPDAETAAAPPQTEAEAAPTLQPAAGPPRFEVNELWTPKRGNTESDWEDG